MKYETLLQNKWISLKRVIDKKKKIKGYVYSHETRCDGKIVSILPFRVRNGHTQFLMKRELTPCWSVTLPFFSTITGGAENIDPLEDAVRELAEETGYSVEKESLISLGNSFASKSSDTFYFLFGVNLTNKKRGIPTGDGSGLEEAAESFWVTENEVIWAWDPQAHVMLTRLKNKMEI